MVQMGYDDHHLVRMAIPIAATAFVRRSSTPLIQSFCLNCDCGDQQQEHNYQLDDINHLRIQQSLSFFKWEKKLSSPIPYRVTKSPADDQQSIYVPLEPGQLQKYKLWDCPVGKNPFGPKTQPDYDHHYNQQQQQRETHNNNHHHRQKLMDEELFLDPAVMGIKRQRLPPRGSLEEVTQHDGMEFIRGFVRCLMRRGRQCSFIEAHMKNNARRPPPQPSAAVVYCGQ